VANQIRPANRTGLRREIPRGTFRADRGEMLMERVTVVVRTDSREARRAFALALVEFRLLTPARHPATGERVDYRKARARALLTRILRPAPAPPDPAGRRMKKRGGRVRVAPPPLTRPRWTAAGAMPNRRPAAKTWHAGGAVSARRLAVLAAVDRERGEPIPTHEMPRAFFAPGPGGRAVESRAAARRAGVRPGDKIYPYACGYTVWGTRADLDAFLAAWDTPGAPRILKPAEWGAGSVPYPFKRDEFGRRPRAGRPKAKPPRDPGRGRYVSADAADDITFGPDAADPITFALPPAAETTLSGRCA
jgi:hypothetical protein